MIEVTCAVAAVLFFFSNVLGFAFFNRYNGRDGFSWKAYQNLNTDLIQAEFDYRHDEYFFELRYVLFCFGGSLMNRKPQQYTKVYRFITHSSGLLNAIAWMIFCIPLIQVAWIQSRRGTFMLGTHVTIAALSIGGSITELISRLMYIGSTTTTNWVARRFNLENWIDIADGDAEVVENGGERGAGATRVEDMIGWRVLEMIYIVTRGLIAWIDSAEWLFLATIMFLIYVSVHKSEETSFSRKWARFGLSIGAMAFLHFASDILRLRKWITYAPVAVFLSAISRIFLIPIWLVWLGIQLSSARHDAQPAAIPPNHYDSKKGGTAPDTCDDSEAHIFS